MIRMTYTGTTAAAAHRAPCGRTRRSLTRTRLSGVVLIVAVTLTATGGCAADGNGRAGVGATAGHDAARADGTAGADRAMARGAARDVVIEAPELARLLAAGGVLVLDARDAADYAAGHVTGAVWIDPAEWKEESLAADTGLDHETLWRQRIGALGVSGQAPVVIYDDGRMTEAARVWFIFQHFGVPEAHVLNGGYPALASLSAAGQVAVSRTPTAPRPVAFRPAGTTAPRVAVAERQAVRTAVERGEAQVFDARSREEYAGVDLRTNTRGGHIPTAINVPHRELLDEHGRLKAPDVLAELLAEAGFRPDRPVITHCDGGGRASLAALAAQRAGYGPVLNYYLSYGDWAADASCPVVGGAE